jgi:hypothetical protein
MWFSRSEDPCLRPALADFRVGRFVQSLGIRGRRGIAFEAIGGEGGGRIWPAAVLSIGSDGLVRRLGEGLRGWAWTAQDAGPVPAARSEAEAGPGLDAGPHPRIRARGGL